ncbi:peptidase S8 [Candidatus Kaiserbacteria bacterium]|nr:MAG: peptidase S8 [Candidatus Kaiserbacteria bacterium]
MKFFKNTLVLLLSVAVVIPFSVRGSERDDRGAVSTERLEGMEARVDERLRGLEKRFSSFRDDEVVVKFANDDVPRLIRSKGISVETLLSDYSQRNDVEYVEPNYIASAFLVPNDPQYQNQWNFDNPINNGIGAEEAWNVSTGSGVVVAIIDTGVAYENYQQGSWFFDRINYYRAPDLAGTTFVPGYDFVNDDTHPNDDEGHGTHVAGTIAGTTNNSEGVSGLAYGAKIMPIKVLDANGSGTYFDITEGIRFAADNGAKVINLSLGGSSGATYLEDALRYAYEKGVTIVAASGNNSAGSVSYPAAYDNYVIAVGATRFDKSKASYANYGSSLDIVAPGGDTSVDQNGDGYGDGILQQTFGSALNSFGYYFYQGTSMATPHVAAAAAMVIAQGTHSPSLVRSILEGTADDLGVSGRDDVYGHGLLNVATALGVKNTPPPEPEPSTEINVHGESFESGLGSWSQDSQNDWLSSTQRKITGQRSAEVDGRATNALLSSPGINLSGKTNARVSFSWLIENDFDSGEYIAFDVSTNGGTSWNEYVRLRGNVDAENVWHNYTLNLNDLNTSATLKLRFRATVSGSSEDGNVDNVTVIAY